MDSVDSVTVRGDVCFCSAELGYFHSGNVGRKMSVSVAEVRMGNVTEAIIGIDHIKTRFISQ